MFLFRQCCQIGLSISQVLLLSQEFHLDELASLEYLLEAHERVSPPQKQQGCFRTMMCIEVNPPMSLCHCLLQIVAL